MKFAALIGTLVGIVLAGWLLESYGFLRIMALLASAGWGLVPVIAFHFVQLAFSAAAWRFISGPTPARPSLGGFMALRWIREGVNNLLPVAQIGGEFIAARLLRRRGVPLPLAIAGSVCDLTMEMMTQIAFTLLGLWLLLLTRNDANIVQTVESGIVAGLAAGIGFLLAQWFGLARLIEKFMLSLGGKFGADFGEVEGLHKALVGLYRAPKRLGAAACCHSISWLLGGIEVCLALHFLGYDVSLSAGLVIESIGQALKAAGFAIPGALGVQEGGYIVICQIFGVPPEVAIALSIVKRLREVVLGVPGLIAWNRLESRASAAIPSEIGAAS